jgi:hypothetical protein
MTERNGTRLSDGEITDKDFGVVTCELALEKTVQFGIPRRLLAVGNAHRVRRVTGLLSKDLGKCDQLGVVFEGLCEVDHAVCCILLIAGTSSGKESLERVDRQRVALFTAPGGNTSLLPERKGIGDDLSNALIQRGSRGSGHDQEKKKRVDAHGEKEESLLERGREWQVGLCA